MTETIGIALFGICMLLLLGTFFWATSAALYEVHLWQKSIAERYPEPKENATCKTCEFATNENGVVKCKRGVHVTNEYPVLCWGHKRKEQEP